MKSMCPALVRLYVPLFIIIALFSINLTAQSKKSTAGRKADTKKNLKTAKDARKKDTRRDKQAAKKDSKKDKLAAKREKDRKAEKKKVLELQAKKDKKKGKESKKVELARRRAEEERRQAIIAERRRREQARREAIARKLAFERGLRTETAANILNDKTEGEDLQIRRAAVNALGQRAGTVVVMEAQTGKVLTIVNQDWAIRNGFKPCSTIKLVTGVAGLSQEVITDDGGIRNTSSRLNLDDALAYSSNSYFQLVGSNIGNGRMISYAKALGLGEPTGINAEGETAGKLPYGNNKARIYSHGDDFEVTPLQLAVMVSAISNGGRKVVPTIPRAKVERSTFRPHMSEQINLPRSDLEGVIPGMIGAAEYGTARRGIDAGLGVAGKTGSCIGKGSWVGLFASVAPIEEPKYAVVVITRGQRERGKYAAWIAGQIYNALGPRIGRRQLNNPLFARLKPKTTVDRKNETDVEEEGSDDEMADGETTASSSEDDAAGSNSAPPIVVGQPAVKKIVSSKPATFPPVVITYNKDVEPADKTRPRIVPNK